MSQASTDDAVRENVRSGYAKIAQGEGCCSSASCCGSNAELSEKLVATIGYSKDEITPLPDGANMGLSCGNPTALATLRPGEHVLDLGCGGGFDVFIAGPKVGRDGRVIGVDMTPEMLAKARRNAAVYRERTGLENVEFRLGEIEHLPVADNSMDVVISNCVLNLSPDKPQVWREIFRVLKPGGRVAVSDLALLRPLPEKIKASIEALVSCVAGAVLVMETERMLRAAGFGEIRLEPHASYVDAMIAWSDPVYADLAAQIPDGLKPSDFITSLNISARKL